MASPPVALTIAGSDPSGGAGIQADLKTFTALGVYGASIITALTAQNTQGVTGIHAVPQDFIRLQADTLAADIEVGAVKTGMLGDRATVDTVAGLLSKHDFGPVVVDPVMVATSGDVLLAPDAVGTVVKRLIPRAHLITPNLHEAAHLLGEPIATSLAEMEGQATRLRQLGPGAVLVKGGHGEGVSATDVLATADGIERFVAARIATRNTHGTGCTLSAAIAAELARGTSPINEAVRRAKAYLTDAIRSGAGYAIGRGHGPVDHLVWIRDRT
ncbi:MAG: bifunctional hydroxymethylpyrimidine kinase/phosphomethylpyrimidine kinase [Hyphomicrobium sp.]|nr:bifunctional hydroxymethylpyrimidine kinase/phosphomethylpyrimidine kinase [Hyphomicrobium sp.]